MPNQKDTLAIRNTSPTLGTVQDFRKLRRATLHIENGLDQDVAVAIESSAFDDKPMAKAIETHETTVAAGASDYLETDEAWSFLRAKTTASVSPTSGDLVLTWVFKGRA